MRKLYLLVMGMLLFACPVINAQVSLTALNSPYTQDFNTLVASGSSTYNTFPAGWFVVETGGAQADGKYAVGNGSSNSGNTYSFGTGSSTDRALGGLRSGSLVPVIEAAFTNNTGNTVSTLQITYTGEEWRLGTTARQDSLYFQYSMDTSVASNWTRVKTGDFWTPNTTAATGSALDGNATSNRKIISFAITGLSIPDGGTFFIRWTDFDAAGADDGLAVDDFSITPGTALTSNVFVSAGTNGAEPSTDGSFTVSLTAASATDVTVNYDFTGSTATLGSDFTDPLAGALVIPAGQLSGTIPIHVLDDAIVEPTEGVTLNLTGASAPYTISIPSGTINITSDDIATISFTGSYSQDFNTMVASGTGTVTDLPTGWLFNETGTNANDTYAAGDGTSNAGNTYSFGTGTSTDRAMGMLRSSNLIPVMGSFYINNTGATVTSLTITYTGEQWRLGATGRNDRLDFQFSTDATNLSTGTWTDANGLDFISPNSTPVGPFDGNATANRTTLTYTINGLSIPNGSEFAIRWTDLDVTGAEDGLAVDDFTMTLGCTPPTNQPTALNLTPSLQSITGSFTAAAAGTTNADAYLVLISTSATLSDMPASGTVYAIDDVIGNAKVVSIGNTTTFTASGLTPSTTYYFYIISTGGTTCYNVTSPLTGNTATTAPPVCTPPVTQASNLSATNITGTSIDLSWTRGDGDNVLVIAKAGAAVDATIYNSIGYPQDTVLGTGNRVIYNGPASAFSYTGLSENTTYYLALYEYKTVDSCYLTPALTGNFTTLCTNPVDVSSLSGSAGNTTAGISWTLPASACFDEIIVVASNASITNPGSTYTAPANAAYTGGEQVVYRGTGTTVPVTGLTNGTTYYFKVFTRKGTNYSAGVQITVIPFNPASGYLYLYGNLHGHSSYSDGNKEDVTKTPADDFAFARDALCMDFLGISEHNHSGAGMNKANFPLGYAQANSLNGSTGTSGSPFITLYGMEWGVISGGGHVLVYGFDDKLIGWESGNYDIFVAKSDYPSLWTVVNGQSGAFATLAHPNNTDFSNLASAYNATADAALVGAAVESGPAFSTSITYNDFPSSLGYLSYYKTMLAKGFRLAPQMDQDNHYLTFGRDNSNRMVVLSSARSREALTEAIRSMRYYASEDCNIRVDYKSGSSPMGSEITGVGVPSLSMNITDPDNESVTKIELWGGATGAAVPSAAIKTYTGTSVPSFNFTAADVENTQPNNSTWYYYTVITQEDGNKVVTAPIWYTRNDAALPITLSSFKGTYDHPANKVYLTWTTAQELNSKEFIIERSTDGRQFTALGKVAAAGNTSRQTAYSFTDPQPAYGVNYYRLNQVDLDGRSEISGIVKIITDNAGGFITGPNPASTSVTVYRQNNTEAAKIELMDVNGKLLKQLNMGGAVPSTTINVSSLSKGVYLLKLTTGKGIQTEKIMVQ